MDPEADRIGCGRSYDHKTPCVFHTVCMLSSHGDWYVVPRDQVKKKTLTDCLVSVQLVKDV